MSEAKHRQFPLGSVISSCCPLLLVCLFLFLATPQAAAINERLCVRYYTLGMLLVFGLYVAIGLGLLFCGIVLGVLACLRREVPSWLAWAAVAANILAAFTAVLYLKGQLSAWKAISAILFGSLVAGSVRGVLVKSGNKKHRVS